MRGPGARLPLAPRMVWRNGYDVAVSNPDAGNLASRRVLEKNGFKLVREAQVASERSQTPVAIYRLAASGSGGNDL